MRYQENLHAALKAARLAEEDVDGNSPWVAARLPDPMSKVKRGVWNLVGEFFTSQAKWKLLNPSGSVVRTGAFPSSGGYPALLSAVGESFWSSTKAPELFVLSFDYTPPADWNTSTFYPDGQLNPFTGKVEPRRPW